MTIAYLINQYPQASQSFIRREIAALEAQGVRVERFTVRRWETSLVDEGDRAERDRTRCVLEAGKGRLLLAPLKMLLSQPRRFMSALKAAIRLGRRSDRGMAYHLIYLAEACVLLPWLKACGAEHVHAHFGTNSTTVALLCRKLGGPTYSFTAHGPEEFDRPLTLKLGDKIAEAAFVVAVSEFGRSQLYRWCDPDHWPKIHVVRCGVDESFLRTDEESNPEAPAHAIDDDAPPRLVCVGRLAEQKGQLILVEAAGQLVARGMNFEVVLVGDGDMRPRIEASIVRLGLERTVRIAGWMSNAEVRREILASRALVLPSFAEGLPVVIMEALALRRPVISTHIAGIPELVESGQCGYLVPAGSVDALAAAMARVLLGNTAELRSMGEEGANRVRQQHKAMTEARRLADLFAAAINNCVSTGRASIAAERAGTDASKVPPAYA